MELFVLRTLAWLEIVAAMVLLTVAVWPFSGYCSGRFMGMDCESRAIFGVLMFGPLGILALACSTWTLISKSVTPQYVLIFGTLAVVAYWIYHLL
jgi:hypothetical protein